ncbi:MAG: hypothetical protein K0M69_00090 [Youngiibacter sp.]|nr:hypothetical protein [Youngiibacter sp.]
MKKSMGFKCKICGLNEVERVDVSCDECAISMDPYASELSTRSNTVETGHVSLQTAAKDTYVPGGGKRRKVLVGSGAEINGRDPYGNRIESTQELYNPVQPSPTAISKPSQRAVTTSNPQSNTYAATTTRASQPITSGITRNISVDRTGKPFLVKWARTFFTGIPFMWDGELTMFQIFPDYTGSSINAMGNACDQVIVYGKLNAGAVSENNDVEVYGYRDANNNIVAKRIVNRASGTLIVPTGYLSPAIIWIVTIILALSIYGLGSYLGVQGIVWGLLILFCLVNLPWVLKVIGALLGLMFIFFRKKK